jgi:hypothetical protein
MDNINQLNMSLKEGRNERWLKFKKRLERIEKRFELTPFWKYGLNIFALVTIFFLAGALLFGYINYYAKLPAEIPLIYDQTSEIWILYPKVYLLMLSGIFLLAEIGIFILTYYIYFFDKRLSIVINLIAIVTTYLFLLGIAQILSFELV